MQVKLTVKEISERVWVERRYVIGWLRAGKLKGEKRGGRWVVDEAVLVRFCRDRGMVYELESERKSA